MVGPISATTLIDRNDFKLGLRARLAISRNLLPNGHNRLPNLPGKFGGVEQAGRLSQVRRIRARRMAAAQERTTEPTE
jgi:hypothetical protein